MVYPSIHLPVPHQVTSQSPNLTKIKQHLTPNQPCTTSTHHEISWRTAVASRQPNPSPPSSSFAFSSSDDQNAVASPRPRRPSGPTPRPSRSPSIRPSFKQSSQPPVTPVKHYVRPSRPSSIPSVRQQPIHPLNIPPVPPSRPSSTLWSPSGASSSQFVNPFVRPPVHLHVTASPCIFAPCPRASWPPPERSDPSPAARLRSAPPSPLA